LPPFNDYPAQFMRAVIQRVRRASVTVDRQQIGSINKGLLLFLGIHRHDTEKELAWMVDKVVNLRVFEDKNSRMNQSLMDIQGEILIVSQFTLYGDCRKGRRPGFSEAAPPEHARKLYHKYIEAVRKKGLTTASGTFQAMMDVSLVNDGPVTLLIDSAKLF